MSVDDLLIQGNETLCGAFLIYVDFMLRTILSAYRTFPLAVQTCSGGRCFKNRSGLEYLWSRGTQPGLE